jgi:hypothetical protein
MNMNLNMNNMNMNVNSLPMTPNSMNDLNMLKPNGMDLNMSMPMMSHVPPPFTGAAGTMPYGSSNPNNVAAPAAELEGHYPPHPHPPHPPHPHLRSTAGLQSPQNFQQIQNVQNLQDFQHRRTNAVRSGGLARQRSYSDSIGGVGAGGAGIGGVGGGGFGHHGDLMTMMMMGGVGGLGLVKPKIEEEVMAMNLE